MQAQVTCKYKQYRKFKKSSKCCKYGSILVQNNITTLDSQQLCVQNAITVVSGSYYLTRGDSSFTGLTNCSSFCQKAFTSGLAGGTAYWVKCYTLANNLNSNQLAGDYPNTPAFWTGYGNNVTDCNTRKLQH